MSASVQGHQTYSKKRLPELMLEARKLIPTGQIILNQSQLRNYLLRRCHVYLTSTVSFAPHYKMSNSEAKIARLCKPRFWNTSKVE